MSNLWWRATRAINNKMLENLSHGWVSRDFFFLKKKNPQNRRDWREPTLQAEICLRSHPQLLNIAQFMLEKGAGLGPNGR